jgi:dihydrofolate reductase
MAEVVVMNGITLDGVMQSPGRPDEDTRDGFAHGGWAIVGGDELMVAKMGERMGEDRAFLFGRRTYEDLLASWNRMGGPFKDALNNAPKYIASHSSATRLGWPNSTLLHDDVPAAVAELKRTSNANLVIMGSGELIAGLMTADLIDEYLLMIPPASARQRPPTVPGGGAGIAPAHRLHQRGLNPCLQLESVLVVGFSTCDDLGIRLMTCGFDAPAVPAIS